MSVFQYAKSDDAEILAAIRHNSDGRDEFHKAACAFALRFGAEKGAYYPGGFFGTSSIRAIACDERPSEGRWSQGYKGIGWRPRKGTDLAAEMDAIHHEPKMLPDTPQMVEGPYNRDGSQVVMTPALFIHDGWAYFGVSNTPQAEQMKYGNRQIEMGNRWIELRGSEYLAAKEAAIEATK